MEPGGAETRAEKAARLRPELFRLLYEFDPPEEERSEAEQLIMQAREAWLAELAEEHRMEEQRMREEQEAAWTHDRRPLGSRFQDTNKQTREGGGLPEGGIIPAGITHDLVLQFDLPARKAEREERLLAFNGGDVNETLYDICWYEGGGKDARFLLAHGADANHLSQGDPWYPMIKLAAERGRLTVVEALLDAGAGRIDEALVVAVENRHTEVAGLLLDRGADVHYVNGEALHFALLQGSVERATLLLQRGAIARPGMLAFAVERGNQAIADLLRAHGAV